MEPFCGLISGVASSNWITFQYLLTGERLIQRNAFFPQYSDSSVFKMGGAVQLPAVQVPYFYEDFEVLHEQYKEISHLLLQSSNCTE